MHEAVMGIPVGDYPDGYVEPMIPEFYAALSRYAEKAPAVLASFAINQNTKSWIVKRFIRFKRTANRLRYIAQAELEGVPFTEEQTAERDECDLYYNYDIRGEVFHAVL